MESEEQARSMGEQRSAAASSGGSEHGFSSGFHPSGSEPESHGGFGGESRGGGGFRGGGGRGRR